MKGTFVLSVDVELAWGFVPSGRIDNKRLKAVSRVRAVLDPFLNVIRDYEIPVTWCILGHLFLDSCSKNHISHSDMPRPHYNWFEGDWYKFDPSSNLQADPFWYGKDIAMKIVEFAEYNPIEQEIGCHSFSHQVYGDKGCSEELARAEIDKCLEIMKDYGIRPRTFAFPLGSVGHLKVLKEKGFSAFCGGPPRFGGRLRLEKSVLNAVRKYVSLGIEFWSYYLFFTPPVVIPRRVLHGLWDVPHCMCFNKKRGVPLDLVVSMAKRGVRRAVREGKCFHLFTHLHNLGVESEAVLKGFESLLSFVNEHVRKGDLQIFNVRGLAEALEQV